jgi:malonyl-CoA decarboxylase
MTCPNSPFDRAAWTPAGDVAVSSIAAPVPPIRIAEPQNLFDRALRRIADAWRDMANSVADSEDDAIEVQMRACLAGPGGEISARNRTAKLAQAYLALDTEGKLDFLHQLAEFDTDPDDLTRAYEAVQQAEDAAERAVATAALRRALEPPRARLLTQFTTLPDGVKFLVDLRSFLLKYSRTDKLLGALDSDLRNLMASWFDVGFLELRRIDWESPASLLEKLVGYEAVHEIRGWSDLKNRLDADRRCYAFFHPRMPTEPLIFVEVALTRGLSGSVQALLDETAPVLNPSQADAAIFYSISSCQRGLSGISFGNFLIKQVVQVLGPEFPNIKTFSTLSPVPGFRRWLDGKLADPEPGLLTDAESNTLRPLEAEATGPAALAAVLARPDWLEHAAAVKVLEPILTRLCARYLLVESRGERAADAVAHFHLSNGARLERINMRGDISAKGVKESASLMVNYLYDPARIEQYHEDYAGAGRRNASNPVKKLARV